MISGMDLGMTPKVKPLVEKVRAMVRDEIMPLEEEYEAEIGKAGDRFVYTKRQTDILEGLKAKARERGLWNFWLTASDKGYGLSTVEYAYLAEEMGWSRLAPEAFNCAAPDTGNMEVLERYGAPAHKEQWLKPLLEGKIRSAYVMTEPGVASSDATNMVMEAKLDGDEWVLNGEKWFASGAGDPRCKIYIVMVCTDPDAPEKHKRHSQILVPAGTEGVEIVRPMHVYGNDDAPHGHMHIRFKDVRVPKDNLILGRGRGFEVSQGRLGPGRIHHCMRAIGQAERALELMCRRSLVARGLRQAAGPARRQLRHHRREPHEDRDGAAPLSQGGLHDGHDLAARGGAVDLADQGGGAAHRAGDHRRGGADARRHGRDAGRALGPHVDQPADAAAGGRPRRGAPAPGGSGGAEAVYEPEDVRRCLPLPAQHQPRRALHQRGERAGVRGSGTLRRLRLLLPLTLTLSPQAGRGDPRGICDEPTDDHIRPPGRPDRHGCACQVPRSASARLPRPDPGPEDAHRPVQPHLHPHLAERQIRAAQEAAGAAARSRRTRWTASTAS